MLQTLVDSLLGRHAHVRALPFLHAVDSHEDRPQLDLGSPSDAAAHRVQAASHEPIHRESFLSPVLDRHEWPASRNSAATDAVANGTWTLPSFHQHFLRRREGVMTRTLAIQTLKIR